MPDVIPLNIIENAQEKLILVRADRLILHIFVKCRAYRIRYDSVQVLLFNKSIAEQYDIENLYQCVTEGRWTVDKMGEVCRLTTKELDGNGKMNRYDQWGYASQNNDYFPR